METSIELKKYANRRLYYADQKKFVALVEVAELIRRGQQVKVIDAKTREDVTAFILTQIVLEQARNHHTLLPVPLLHLIIQYGDNMLSGFFEKYLEQVVQSYLHYKSSFDEHFQHWLDIGSGLSKVAKSPLNNLNPLHSFFKGFSDKDESDKDKPV